MLPTNYYSIILKFMQITSEN